MTVPPRFRTHWRPRPGWSDDARYLTFHLLPAGPVRLLVAVGLVHEALASVPVLDPVPAPWLHLTVQGVGFRESIRAEDVARLVEVARAGLVDVAPVRLRLTPPEVHSEGILLTGTPAEHVAVLRGALRSAVADVLGPESVPGSDDEPVWPHLSLAYANADAPTGPAVDALTRLHRHPSLADPLVLELPRVSLIELRTQGRLYRWESVAELPLGGTPASGPAGAR